MVLGGGGMELAGWSDGRLGRLRVLYPFGRMAMPVGRLEQAVWAEFALEAVAVGTSDSVAKFMALLENAWREANRGGSGGHRGVGLASATADVIANVDDYSALLSLGWAPQLQLGSGHRSVRAPDIMRWLEYLHREADDRVAETAITTARVRRLAQMYASEIPSFNADVAWAWEVAQAAMQAVYSFYFALDAGGAMPGANAQSACVLVLGDPATRTVTVRLVDAVTQVWAVWQVGPALAEGQSPALDDLAVGARPLASKGSYVSARGVAVGGTGATPAPMAWDVRRIESLLLPELRAASTGYGISFGPAGITHLTDQASAVLQTVTTALVQDGTQRRYATVAAADAVVADVCKPSILLTSFDRQRGGLRPHAAWSLAGRARTRSDAACTSCRGETLQLHSGEGPRADVGRIRSGPDGGLRPPARPEIPAALRRVIS